MSLVTLQEVKDYLGETTATYDDFLNTQILLFCEAVEGYCNRKFSQANYTQTFYYDDFVDDRTIQLWLFHFPTSVITSVKEIVTFNGVDDVTTLDPSEYRLKPNDAYLKRFVNGVNSSWFNSSNYYSVSGINSRIEVEYTAGYADTPEIIKDTTFNLIEERYLKKISGVQASFGSNVQRVSIPGTMSIDFDYTLQSNERKIRFGTLLGTYVNNLDFYRSERSLVGEIKENYVV